MLSVSEASEYLGVSISTMRRWEKEGKLIPHRTSGKHRRYDKNDLIKLRNRRHNVKITVGYCRVSSKDMSEELKNQVNNVSQYCIAKGYQFKIIQDLGSGLNYKKKGLDELIELICAEEIDRIVVNYKDRIIRFGYEIIAKLCDIYNVEIEVINHSEDKEYEEELLEDVLSIITDFSSKLYGNRSQKALRIRKETLDLFKKTGA
ncbi:IS607 family transposase [Oceanirhabdus sp. W0125-5]|uniref:IS607 family transposase n=1 Tax=Oceanirhabdus sp. W0125-5 TaxID=2999116 RepID=UPI0022F33240|nr:IS607 family transposase [Oceanirhabdus sp. W0125-5]WBW96502.1 IS607 family transposase [Oceanirhabdus sp. W0125-5]